MQGFSSGMPLIIDSEILKEASMLFKKAVYNPNKIFYFGETIIASSYRKKSYYRKIVSLREKTVKEMGYDKVCFMKVKREKNHPQQPKYYEDPGPIFSYKGYKKTEIETSFNYLTILQDGK